MNSYIILYKTGICALVMEDTEEEEQVDTYDIIYTHDKDHNIYFEEKEIKNEDKHIIKINENLVLDYIKDRVWEGVENRVWNGEYTCYYNDKFLYAHRSIYHVGDHIQDVLQYNDIEYTIIQ